MKMRYMIICMLLWMPAEASSQLTQIDTKFVLITNNGNDYDVKVQIKTNSSSAQLGSSNFVFRFDHNSISMPVTTSTSGPTSTTDYLYNSTFNDGLRYSSNITHNVRPTGVHEISLNVIYNPNSNGFGVSVGQSWVDLVTLYFSTTNSSGSSNLEWDTVSTISPVYGDTLNLPLGHWWFKGSWQNLNTSPLPVELISFSGYDRGDRVHLHWETATEFENYGFEIQRKEGEGEWKPIGFVPGKGTVNYPVVYDWDDGLDGLRTPRVFLDKLRYRLRQIDRDGTDELSPIVEVAMGETPSVPQLTAYPNPARGQTAAACVLQEQRNVTLTLHDAAGREVLRLLDAQDVPAGSHVYDLQTDQLSPGMYMLRMLAGRHVSVQNLTVLK